MWQLIINMFGVKGHNLVLGFNNQWIKKRDFDFGPIFCQISPARTSLLFPNQINSVRQYHLYWITSLFKHLGLTLRLLNHLDIESVVHWITMTESIKFWLNSLLTKLNWTEPNTYYRGLSGYQVLFQCNPEGNRSSSSSSGGRGRGSGQGWVGVGLFSLFFQHSRSNNVFMGLLGGKRAQLL